MILVSVSLTVASVPICCWRWDWIQGWDSLNINFILFVSLFCFAFGYFHNHLHVMWLTPTSHSSMKVSAVGGGYEIIFLSRFELQSSRSWCEWSECDCKVHESLWSVANCHNSWSGAGDSAIVKLFSFHTIDNMLFTRMPILHHWTYQVNLVILPGKIVFVNSYLQGTIHSLAVVVFQ